MEIKNVNKPIKIYLSKTKNEILSEEYESLPLLPGALFQNYHQGFVIISDFNGKHNIKLYPTESEITGIGFQGDKLLIIEKFKNKPWVFTLQGELKFEASEYNVEYYERKLEYPKKTLTEDILLNPIKIKLSNDPYDYESTHLIKEGDIKEDYPVTPGVMLGTEHYGFILVKEDENGLKETAYPTQSRIEGIGTDEQDLHTFQIYEEGKYHPWVITHRGEIIKTSSFNPYSLKDALYIEDKFLNMNGIKYVLKKRL